MDLFYLILFFLSFFIVAYKYIRHSTNCGMTTSFVLIVYSFSAFFAIIYYLLDVFDKVHNLKFLAFVIWWLLFIISLLPLYIYDRQKIKSIKFKKNVLNYCCIIGLMTSILPFIEYIMHLDLLMQSADLETSLLDMHDEAEKPILLSNWGQLSMKFSNYVYYVVLLSIIPVFQTAHKNIFAVLGIILMIVNRVLPGVILSSRPMMIQSMIQLIVVFVLFYPLMDENTRKKSLSFGIKALVIIFSGIIFVTIYRHLGYIARGSDTTLLYFISRYVGEGITNFAQYILDIKYYFNGDICFWLFKDILGLNPIEMSRDLSYALESKTGYPGNEFYTYIGNFIQDIGIFGTLVFFTLLSFILCKYFRCNKKYTIKLSTLYIVLIYTTVIIYGTMFYQYSWSTSVALKGAFVGWFVLKVTNC